ncbi:hypothetical protein C8F04DRAFT_1394427 [Mycena alexandri]|uniref:SMAD/FHA domain-containing protein n=1 Tax=Mycena alexandri TaxID=1745969 RepID=A0AAD6SZK8_9AGAR|nr:hypothetical protein C8F04DRAFT_1394427 [Mycena alexandri]
MDSPTPDSAAARATSSGGGILGSFLGRGRPRNSSQSHIEVPTLQHPHPTREMSPSPPHHAPPGMNPFAGMAASERDRELARERATNAANASAANVGVMMGIPAFGSNRRRPAPPAVVVAPQPSSGGGGGLNLSHMLRRRRSAGNVATPTTTGGVVPPTPAPHVAPSRTHPPPSSSAGAGAGNATAAGGPTHRIRLVPHLDSRRSLRFDPISRDLRPVPLDPALRIGRFTDRSGLGLSAVNALNGSKIAFKSKVVSRAHAEVWCEEGTNGAAPKFFIRDTKSSSGTFLNHVRLSPAGTESRPHPLKDGDILQLGVDYQGGAEDIYKSVKIRVELGREWQGRVNGFNTTALNNLKSLALGPPGANASSASASAPGTGTGTGTAAGPGGKRRKDGGGIPDCCICLFPVSIRQALFIAPCSHAFHYKCLRPLLEAHHPAFSCPLCRTFADLEEDVEVEAEEGDDEFENPDAFTAEPVVSLPIPGDPAPTAEVLMEEGVLADDLEGDDGEGDDEFGDVPRFGSGAGLGLGMGGGGAETEVEDNVGIGHGGVRARQRSAHPMDEDLPAPPDDEMDVESGEGSGSAEGGLQGATLGGKRKR